jgi:ABC-2 type transport system permease protein
MIAILFGSIFGGSGAASKMKIAIADQDRSADSGLFVSKLKSSPSLDVVEEDAEQGKAAVRKGDLVALVVVPKGFGENSVFSGQQPALQVAIDPSRKAEAGMIQGLLAEASFAPMQKMFSDPKSARTQLEHSLQQAESSDMTPEDKASLVKFLGAASQYFSRPADDRSSEGFSGPKIETISVQNDEVSPNSSFDITFPQGIVWGLVGVATAFVVGIVKERSDGTFYRLKVAPVTRFQLILGKGVACFLSCLGVISILLLVGKFGFGLHVSNFPLTVLAVASSALCFVGVVMALSVLGKSEQAVAGGGRAILLLFSMFGGGMIPVFMMPGWMQTVSSFSPAKWAVVALEGSIWRGYSLSEMIVPCSILVTIGLVGFAVGATVLGRASD